MLNNLKYISLIALLLMPVGILIAQSQSMLLPLPANSQIINFTEVDNPVITTLPFHDFTYNNGTPNGNPHNEGHLENSDISINEKYLGQHPMYAQTVVHDKEGNLLFFIVDNNIYNQDGEAFPKLDETGVPYGYNMVSYLYDGEVEGNTDWVDGSTYNRFTMGGSLSIDPEIVVFPI